MNFEHMLELRWLVDCPYALGLLARVGDHPVRPSSASAWMSNLSIDKTR
jgi:hypothetical protein